MSVAAAWRRYLGRPDPRAAVPGDLPRRLARLRLHAARRLASSWAGAYRTAFKGEGLEFAGVRPYVAGDDVRTVDWRVTARTGHLAVRRYVEERNRTVLFVVDVGAATITGSGDRTLLDVAADAVALVGSAAIAGGDRIALLAWSDRRELLLPPRRSESALLDAVRALLSLGGATKPGRLADALAQVPRLLRRSGVLVVISPFLDEGIAPILRALARRHELLALRLWDARAARGTATARVPARDVRGAPGWAESGVDPERPVLAGVRGDVLTVGPQTLLAATLMRAFVARAGRRGA